MEAANHPMNLATTMAAMMQTYLTQTIDTLTNLKRDQASTLMNSCVDIIMDSMRVQIMKGLEVALTETEEVDEA
jgi:hypothetical protein